MRKTIARFTIITLCILTVTTSFSFAASDETYIRVGLTRGSGAVSSCIIQCDDGLMIVRAGPGGFEELLALPDCYRLSISVESSYIVARNDSGAAVYDNFDEDTCVASSSGGVVKYGDTLYRGGICFYKRGGGSMNVINCVGLDSYAYGVLNSEMGYLSPAEALKAQAVTARSFAVCNLDKHKDEGFDVCADAHCQLYKGYSGEYAETNRAVDETAGMLIKYDGKPVSGYYFKNSGGHTLSSEDVWSNREPHLVGVKDEYSPNYPWSYTLTFSEASSKLKAAGYSIGEVQSAAITSRNPSGGVSSVEFRGTSGNAELKKDAVRSVFGGSNIKSMMFSFGEGNGALASNEEPESPMLSDGNVALRPDYASDIYVVGNGGGVEHKTLSEIYVFSVGAASKFEGYAQTDIGNVGAVEAVTTDPIVFRGAGFGHGVGMPQDSAIEMAKQGFTYEEILKYFYTGIEIQ